MIAATGEERRGQHQHRVKDSRTVHVIAGCCVYAVRRKREQKLDGVAPDALCVLTDDDKELERRHEVARRATGRGRARTNTHAGLPEAPCLWVCACWYPGLDNHRGLRLAPDGGRARSG